MFTLCLLYVYFMFTLCLLYVYFMFTFMLTLCLFLFTLYLLYAYFNWIYNKSFFLLLPIFFWPFLVIYQFICGNFSFHLLTAVYCCLILFTAAYYCLLLFATVYYAVSCRLLLFTVDST